MTFTVFTEVATLIALATLFGLAGLLLRQPLIVAFLMVGIVAGPSVLDLAQSEEQITLLSDLGVSLLLFVVGLRLDPHLVRSVGGVAIATGLGQVLFTSLIGAGICLLLGMDWTTSVYVGIALTFSSTIIIVKLLSDKREIDSLHGRIALGFLVVQDLVVVIALAAISTIGMGERADGETVSASMRALALGAFILLLAGAWLRAERLLARLVRIPELLVMLAIGWASALAALADFIGLGKELGGLAAGVALSGSSVRDALAARLAGIREFLLLFFFISLGAHFDPSVIESQTLAGVVLSVFVLVGNPLIVLAIMGAMGYRKRTGFLAGLTVAQISEFSLVFIALGLSLGHVGGEALGLVTFVGMVTIALSTYMIYYSHTLYAWLEPLLGPFERRHAWRESAEAATSSLRKADAAIIGLGRYGMTLAQGLRESGWQVVGVDFDPEAMAAARRAGIPVELGDAGDPDLLESAAVRGADWIICTVPGWAGGPGVEDPRITLLATLRHGGYKGRIAVTARAAGDERRLQRAGADMIMEPLRDAAALAAKRILESDDKSRGG